MESTFRERTTGSEVSVAAGPQSLEGSLTIPEGAEGIVLFAHGSGSSRHSPRNRFVAQSLQAGGLATLLLDLLTYEEEAVDRVTGEYRFDMGLLAERLVAAIDWLAANPETQSLRLGCFGSSTGAAAALIAAMQRSERVDAIVSRGGRVDMAGSALALVKAPTLLIVGGNDVSVIALNRAAMEDMPGEVRLEIIPGAGHLFEEGDSLSRVADMARGWFVRYLGAGAV
ncbi:MAG: dienelactone hydrolase family protein [Anaerolineae bacterium]